MYLYLVLSNAADYDIILLLRRLLERCFSAACCTFLPIVLAQPLSHLPVLSRIAPIFHQGTYAKVRDAVFRPPNQLAQLGSVGHPDQPPFSTKNMDSSSEMIIGGSFVPTIQPAPDMNKVLGGDLCTP